VPTRFGQSACNNAASCSSTNHDEVITKAEYLAGYSHATGHCGAASEAGGLFDGFFDSWWNDWFAWLLLGLGLWAILALLPFAQMPYT